MQNFIVICSLRAKIRGGGGVACAQLIHVKKAKSGKVKLSKSDGIQGFQFENQRLATTVHRAFELTNHVRISLTEYDLVDKL